MNSSVSNELLKKAGKVSAALESTLRMNNNMAGYDTNIVCFYKETGAAFFSTKKYFQKNYDKYFLDYDNAAGICYGHLYVNCNDLEEYLNIKIDPNHESDYYYGESDLIEEFTAQYDKFIDDIECMYQEGLIDPIEYERLEREIFDDEIKELVGIYGENKREVISDWINDNAYEEDYCCCYDERELERAIA